MIALLMLCGATLGALALLGLILANEKTRATGLLMLLVGVVLVAAVFVAGSSRHPFMVVDPPPVAELRADRHSGVAAQAANQAFDELTEPRIDLGDDSDADAAGDDNRQATDNARSNAPRWVITPPKRVGGAYTTVVDSGHGLTLDACHAATDYRLLEIAAEYVRENGGPATGPVGPTPAGNFVAQRSSEDFGLTFSELRELMWRDEHVEEVETSVATMKRLYTLVEITPEDGQRLVRSTTETSARRERDERLSAVAVIAVSVVGALALVFGVLKLDELTKGYYTKRLLVGVPVAILGIGLAITLLS
ncbi:MAG: hypothetical protein AAGB00_00750 [Planctomycetota bacterium]